MADGKILTKHPLGKSGRNIAKQDYDTLKEAILSALRNRELTHTELFAQLNKSLRDKFAGEYKLVWRNGANSIWKLEKS